MRRGPTGARPAVALLLPSDHGHWGAQREPGRPHLRLRVPGAQQPLRALGGLQVAADLRDVAGGQPLLPAGEFGGGTSKADGGGEHAELATEGLCDPGEGLDCMARTLADGDYRLHHGLLRAE